MNCELYFHCAIDPSHLSFGYTGGDAMNGAIFISYRRDDSEGEAGRLYDDLIRVFRPGAVFMDVSDIHPGKDFRQAIDDNVARCGVLLAVIGPGWTTITDASGARRLDQPNDFVRLEIASALARGIDVIPVLVHGARMPTPAELPESLQNLAYRNCVEITHTRWNSDVELLSRSLREYVRQGNANLETSIIHRSITGEVETIPIPAPSRPVEPEPEKLSRPAPSPSKPSHGVLRAGGAVLALAVAAASGASAYVYLHHKFKHHDRDKDNSAVQASAGQAAASTASADQAGPVPSSATIANLSGNWVNPEAREGQPVRVEIAPAGALASVHIWTRCGAATCDMRSANLGLHGDGITTGWPGDFANPIDEKVVRQTVNMRIYRLGAALHMIYSNAQGSTGWDFQRQ